MAKNNKVDLFLDSGAFSAWSRKTEINIDDYISFIKTHEDDLTVYANLDVIGSAEGTWKNQLHMEKHGLKPLPVFHPMHEDVSWLTKYLDRGCAYIAFGGMAGGDFSSQQITQMLDKVFSEYVCDSKGFPKFKVHGFGITSVPLLVRYPWYSVDSTSWVQTGRFGSIFVPKIIKGKYDYTAVPRKVNVSTKSPKIKEAGQHIKTFSSLEQKEIISYIESKGYKLGHSDFDSDGKEIIVEEGISNIYTLRDELNILYFLDLEKNLPAYPWAFKLKSNKGFGF